MSTRHGPRFGIACMTGYVALFVATNMITKALAHSLPLTEIALFRYAIAIPTIFALMAASGVALQINRFTVHVTRGLLAVVGSLCGYQAIAALPLGDATALFYVAPLLVTAGAVVVLRERTGLLRLSCVLAGFGGVILIAQPHAAQTTGVLAGAGNALCAAAGVLVIRATRSTESALSLAVTTSAVCTAVLIPIAALSWATPTWPEWAALAALGAAGGLATVLLNTAYQSAPAAQLATIDYLAVPASLAVGTAAWADLPTWPAIAGSAIIVAAGIASATLKGTGVAPKPRSAASGALTA